MVTVHTSKVPFSAWFEGARLRTLPAAAAPVFVGAGAAAHLGAFTVAKTFLALIVALSFQVGVNFANDYSDGIRGTDNNRVGPTRLTASGLMPARVVLKVALASFGVAIVAGFALVSWSGTWWMLAVGALAVPAAWFYTGGKRPYGYAGIGLSELLVFTFFGLVATVGTAWVQTYSAPIWLWLAACGIGLSSVALLFVNNIRDIPTDRSVGKTTLAVRLGDGASRTVASVLVLLSALFGAASVWLSSPRHTSWGMLTALVLLIIASAVAFPLLRGAYGSRLLPVLRNAGLFTLSYGLIVGVLLAAL